MKFGDLINKERNVLIVGHESYKNLNKDLITDLKIEHDVYIVTIDLSIHDKFIVEHIKCSKSKINCILYVNGQIKDRYNSDDCRDMSEWINKNLI